MSFAFLGNVPPGRLYKVIPDLLWLLQKSTPWRSEEWRGVDILGLQGALVVNFNLSKVSAVSSLRCLKNLKLELET